MVKEEDWLLINSSLLVGFLKDFDFVRLLDLIVLNNPILCSYFLTLCGGMLIK